MARLIPAAALRWPNVEDVYAERVDEWDESEVGDRRARVLPPAGTAAVRACARLGFLTCPLAGGGVGGLRVRRPGGWQFER